MAILYEVVCESGSAYVGITSSSLSVRRSKHYHKATTEQSGVPFHCALRKYAREQFTWTIVQRDPDFELIKLAECELIDLRRRQGVRLYNLTDGGDGTCGYKAPLEKRMLQSERQRGSHASEQTRKRMSDARRGQPKSEEWKRKMREQMRGRSLPRAGIEKAAASLRGRKLTEQHKANIGASLARAYAEGRR